MNRIKNTFDHLISKNEKALVGFVTAGDPNISESFKIVSAMCDAGMDVLELGVPFSDPTADGPVIQRSSARALEQNVNIGKVLEMTSDLRKNTDIPIILFSYYNPIFVYGAAKFGEDAILAGADGVLVVDLPPEESAEMTDEWKKDDFSLIRLVAPTTPEERMVQIANNASGFIYFVSKTGVTGSEGLNVSNIKENVKLLRSKTDLPICVGFGVSSSQDVKEVASISDGIVIGSAFERIIENNLNNPKLASIIARQVEEYKKASLSL